MVLGLETDERDLRGAKRCGAAMGGGQRQRELVCGEYRGRSAVAELDVRCGGIGAYGLQRDGGIIGELERCADGLVRLERDERRGRRCVAGLSVSEAWGGKEE